MSRGRTALGLFLVGAGALALPALLAATAGRRDLFARVPSAYELRHGGPAPEGAPRGAAARLGPDSSRIRVDSLLGGGAPGLDLITWRADYGNAWRREVTWPSLAGPFAGEGSDVCGYGVRLGAGLFDTSGAGRGLKDVAARRLSALFPYRLRVEEHDIDVVFPGLRSSDFRITLEEDRARIYLEARLMDGTLLSVLFPVRIVSRDGAPVVERIRGLGPVITFTGPSRDNIVQQARDRGAGIGAFVGLLGCVAGPVGCAIGSGVGAGLGAEAGAQVAEQEIPRQASGVVAARIDEALGDLAFGMSRLREPWSPDPARPGDILQMRLGGTPRVSATGIALPLCARVSIGAPKEDPAHPGPVRWGAPAPEPGAGQDAAPAIELTMNADALEQVLHYVWQAGKLRALGRSSVVLHGISEKVRAAAFDFTGLAPRLPPALAPSAMSGDTLSFVLANVEAGSIGPRRVLAHGLLGLRFQQQGDALQLSAELKELRMNCLEATPRGALLTPCLNDLLPVARSAAARPLAYAIPGGDVLERLPRLSFQGMSLQVSDLEVATSSRPVSVRLGVQARIDASNDGGAAPGQSP